MKNINLLLKIGGGKPWNRFGERFDRYKQSITDWRNMGGEVRKKIRAWDVAPGKEYFEEHFRVSRNQIIWGGNYFDLPTNRNFIVWRKTNIPEDFTMAMCEYAWTSFNENAKLYECAPQDKSRFHPTQKPVSLYQWILGRYAQKGDIILDTHAGSASSLVACHSMGHQFVGFEIDPDYYQKARERLELEMAQTSLFD